MMRLLIVCEGLTEVEFASQILKPHLEARTEYGLVVTAPNLRGYRTYAEVKRFLKTIMYSKTPELKVTTMIDFFKIPGDYPGRADLPGTNALEQVQYLEKCFLEDVADDRFFPYLQLHEFEALVLAGLPLLADQRPNRRASILELAARLERDFESPEHVNHQRPPSYWIKDVVPEYDKRTDGVVTATGIGLPRLRERCRHFGQWLHQLESLVSDPPSPHERISETQS